MSIEESIAGLTVSTTELINAVGAQQLAVTVAIDDIAATIARVAALNLVENTSDLGKPVSTKTQAALNAKQPTLVSGTNIKRVNGVDLTGAGDIVIARSATSLNRVAYDDRADLRTYTPEIDDSTVIDELGLFLWVDNQEEPDDDETCFTTTAGQWRLQAPSPGLIKAWDFFNQSILDDWMEDEPMRIATYLTS